MNASIKNAFERMWEHITLKLENITLEWNNILNKPTIPSKTSELVNDSNLATTSQIPTKVSQLENDKNYLTTHQDISGKADTSYVDEQITEANKHTDDSIANLLNNSSEAVDSIYELRDAMEDNADAIEALTTIAGNKVDKVNGKGLSTNDYTTEEKNKLAGIAAGAEVNVQSNWNATSGDAMILNKPTIPTKTSQLDNDSNYATETFVNNAIITALDGIALAEEASF